MGISTKPEQSDNTRWLLVRLLTLLNSMSLVPQVQSEVIAGSSDSISIVFSTPFASKPTVIASVSRNSGDPIVAMNIDEDSITVNGFTAVFGATVPNGNYKLNWIAK